METMKGLARIRQHSIGDILRRSALRYPDKSAVICGDLVWTYRQFDGICNRIANALINLGIHPGDRVAMLSRNSHAFVAMRFAIARIGAVLVPINYMLNADEVAYILQRSGAQTLAVGPGLEAVALNAAAKAPEVLRRIGLPGEHANHQLPDCTDFATLLQADGLAPEVVVESTSPAQIIFTSGTESLPKGAVLSHEAVLWEYVSSIVEGEISNHDTIAHCLPLFHCAQLDCFFGPGIYLGTTNIIAEQAAPEHVLQLIVTHRINSFFAPPSVWISLLRSELFGQLDLSCLQKGYYGASIMPVEVLLEMQERLPGIRLWNYYGQTEIAPLAVVLKPEEQMRKAGAAGRAVMNVETRIVDEHMQEVAVGQVGEIVHRSPQLLTGYYGDPEKTAAAFTGGWFHSGDLAVRDDEGYITIVDRKKDMIKTGGENVASREVEEAIFAMPEVSEVAVVGLPDSQWIEAVTAVVVTRQGKTLSAEQVIAFCKGRIAGFKVPKQVFFTDGLPKNPSGKILKRELRDRYSGQ